MPIVSMHKKYGNFENFEIKCLGEYHDLCVQIDTLFLANVFENFRNKCIEIC